MELKLESLDVLMWLLRVLQALQQGSRPLEALGPLERPHRLFRVVRPLWVLILAQSPRTLRLLAWVPGARWELAECLLAPPLPPRRTVLG